MVESFIEATNNDIDAEIKQLKQPKYSKLSEREQKSLEDLKARDDIIITNVDNVGAVVILDGKGYVRECERQLNNTKHYRHLQQDSIVTSNKLVHNLIERFENEKLIPQNITKGLKINSPRNSRFLYTS